MKSRCARLSLSQATICLKIPDDGQFRWAIQRAKDYGAALDLDPADILDAWEKDRTYWYMNYCQDAKQPPIKSDRVRVFETLEGLKASLKVKGFRCPSCGGISTSPYVCDTRIAGEHEEPCDWKSYGLFGTLGKGVFVHLKEQLRGQEIFFPVAWEDKSS